MVSEAANFGSKILVRAVHLIRIFVQVEIDMNELRRALCALLLLGASFAQGQLSSTNGFGYSINPANSNTITITSYSGSGGTVAIPTNIDGLTVTAIGPFAFVGLTSLTNVTVGNTVSNIGDDAFYDCVNLASIGISTNATTVGNEVFAGTGLTSVVVPASLTNIGAWAFSSCAKLTNMTLPAGLASIAEGTFAYCSSLGGLTIPAGVTSLGAEAFQNAGLTNVTVPAGVNTISNNVFYGCSKLSGALLGSHVGSIESGAFQGCSRLGNFNLPAGVTNIGANAFNGCARLANVALPVNLASIGDDAFASSGLTNVTIPAAAISLGQSIFVSCTNLTDINVDPGNAAYSSSGGVLLNKSQTTLLEYPDGASGGYFAPNGITVIGPMAFAGAILLSNVIVPNSVNAIEDDAFSGCVNLGAAIIGSGVASIGEDAFSSCPSLTNVYFDGNAPAADTTVFSGDHGVTVFFLPGTSGWGDTFGGVTAVMLNAPRPSGSLRVNITPTGAIAAGARWQVDGGVPQPGGAAVFGLAIGAHVVSFTSVNGWIAPVNIMVNVTTNGGTNVTGGYVSAGPSQGQAELFDNFTADTGLNTSLWSSSSGLMNALAGAVSVPSSAFVLPSISFNAAGMQMTGANGAFQFTGIQSAPAFDAPFSVNATVNGSVTHGDAWRLLVVNNSLTNWLDIQGNKAGIFIDSTGNGSLSGAGQLLYATTNTNVFYSVSATINASGNASVSIATNGILIASTNVPSVGTGPFYLVLASSEGFFSNTGPNVATWQSAGVVPGAPQGALEASLQPLAAIEAGAQWQVEGGPLENSGAIVSNLAAGTYWLSFVPAPGWTSPADQFVTVTNGSLTSVTGIYFPVAAPSNSPFFVTNGAGTIQRASLFAPGKKYTVTAHAASKNTFQNWTGGTNSFYTLLSTNASYVFTNEPGLLLAANFVTNIFNSAQGGYRGLFGPADSSRTQSNSGFFTFNLTSSGAVSGNLHMGSQAIALAGKFGAVGGALTITSKRHGARNLTTTLQLDLPNHAVNGTVSDGTFVAQLNGFEEVFSGQNPATGYAGRYTVIIPGVTNPAMGPAGTGYGTVTVAANGNITFAGSLADGTSFSEASALSQNGVWPLYISLYSGKGSFWSWLYFTNGMIFSEPYASWINPKGFTNQQVLLTGGAYNPGAQPLLMLTNGQVFLEGGGLPSALTNQITLGADNKITVTGANTNGLALSLTKTNGVVSGSFVNPLNPPQKLKIAGVLTQWQTNAAGYFIDNGQSGAFSLIPQ